MSDFSCLLGQLKKTADAVKAEPKRSKAQRQQDSKRRRKNENSNDDQNSNTRKRPCQTTSSSSSSSSSADLPKDYSDLGITLSFLGIGAQKAGTSWLHAMLSRHPDLTLPTQKEVHFWDWKRRKGLGWYTEQFLSQVVVKSDDDDDDDPTSCFGEITPCYAVLPDRDVREIYALFPKLKIVFIARDIVERTWSAVTMELRNSARGLKPGEFASDDLVGGSSRKVQCDEEEENNPDKYTDDYFIAKIRNETHAVRSDYATSLKTWLRHFPKEQILILDYKDLSQNPKLMLGRICRHIGLSGVDAFLDSLSEGEIKGRINVAAAASGIRPSLQRKMEQCLRPYAQDFNDLLEELGYEWKINEYAVAKT